MPAYETEDDARRDYAELSARAAAPALGSC